MTASSPSVEAIFCEALEIARPRPSAGLPGPGLRRRRGPAAPGRGAARGPRQAPASFLEAAGRGADRRPSTRRPPREAPGTVIGPYKLLEQIGEGGMGVGLRGRADRSRCAARWR